MSPECEEWMGRGRSRSEWVRKKDIMEKVRKDYMRWEWVKVRRVGQGWNEGLLTWIEEVQGVR